MVIPVISRSSSSRGDMGATGVDNGWELTLRARTTSARCFTAWPAKAAEMALGSATGSPEKLRKCASRPIRRAFARGVCDHIPGRPEPLRYRPAWRPAGHRWSAFRGGGVELVKDHFALSSKRLVTRNRTANSLEGEKSGVRIPWVPFLWSETTDGSSSRDSDQAEPAPLRSEGQNMRRWSTGGEQRPVGTCSGVGRTRLASSVKSGT